MGARLAIDACAGGAGGYDGDMKNILRLLALASTALLSAHASALQTTLEDALTPTAVDLAQQGDDPAWTITEGLTTEIGSDAELP